MHDERFVLTGFLLAHEAMRRDARRLASACAVADGDELRALGRWFARFRAHLDEHHDAEEDLFFPILRARDARLAAGLDALSEDHRELVATLAALAAAFDALDRDAILAHAAALAALFDRHLAAEEALVVPATSARMSAAEQRALEDDLQRRAPISGVAFLLPWVLSALPGAQQDALLRELPLPMRVLHRVVWRRSYARLAAPLALADSARRALPLD